MYQKEFCVIEVFRRLRALKTAKVNSEIVDIKADKCILVYSCSYRKSSHLIRTNNSRIFLKTLQNFQKTNSIMKTTAKLPFN